MNGRKVLVVDDVPAMRHLLKSMLSDCSVLEAGSAREVFETLSRDTSVELILLDVSLPDLSGHEVLAKLAEERKSRGFKVCFVTGSRDRASILKALELGADDYVLKPVDQKVLLSKMDTLFGGQVEGFVKMKTNFTAICKRGEKMEAIKVKELSEAGLAIETYGKLEAGSKISLESPVLAERLGAKTPLICSVLSCRSNKGTHYADCVFVGLQEAVAQKIRTLTMRGISLEDA